MFLINDNIVNFAGYAKAVRELWAAIAEEWSGVKFFVPPNQPFGYVPEKIYPLITRSMPKLSKDDAVFYRPYFNSMPSTKAALIANVVLESTHLPERLVKECNDDRVAQVWMPSEHCRKYAVESGIIDSKIYVIPHGYDPEIFKPNLPFHRAMKKADKTYTFVFVGGYTGIGDRKGADLLVEAFNEAFKDIQDVVCALKINTTYGMGSGLEGKGIIVDDHNYIDSDMAQHYQTADCFVNPSYAEGFNMSMLEAMACGLPIITSTFGGYDYVDFSDLRVYPLTTTTVPATPSPWDCGFWEKPDLESLISSLQAAYWEKPKKKTYKHIKNYTWSKAAKLAVKALEEL